MKCVYGATTLKSFVQTTLFPVYIDSFFNDKLYPLIREVYVA